jgi:PKHD-type hydroxylase
MSYQNSSPCWTFKTDPVNYFAYWENFLSSEECDFIIKYSKNLKLKEANVVGGSKVGKSYRKSEICFINPCEELRPLYEKITNGIINLNERFFGFNLFGLLEGLQFTSYKAPGGTYGRHVDCAHGVQIRKLSFVIQLTDPKKYKGGDLNLYHSNTPTISKKDRGFLFVFPSYTLHEVTPVTKGERNSLVGWVAGEPFK